MDFPVNDDDRPTALVTFYSQRECREGVLDIQHWSAQIYCQGHPAGFSKIMKRTLKTFGKHYIDFDRMFMHFAAASVKLEVEVMPRAESLGTDLMDLETTFHYFIRKSSDGEMHLTATRTVLTDNLKWSRRDFFKGRIPIFLEEYPGSLINAPRNAMLDEIYRAARER